MIRRIVYIMFILIGSFAVVLSLNHSSGTKGKIRAAGVAGSFYPGDRESLIKMVDQLLADAQEIKLPGKILGIVAPHAGYVYSGYVAAHSYKQLYGQDIRRVIILSPSHLVSFSGASVYNGDGYETPLGILKVDKEFAEQLSRNNALIHLSDQGHETIRNGRMEHALEVQLPFLQRTLKDFTIVPIVMGEQSYATCRALGYALSDLIRDDHTIIVASSDLSHYHPYEEAKKLDKSVILAVEEWDYYNLNRNLSGRLWEACGGGPIVSMMIAAENLNASQAKILKYANSGDVPAGDKSRVVGYSAIAIYKPENKDFDKGFRFNLSQDEQQYLLHIAHKAVESAVRDGEILDCDCKDYPALEIERGAFVTLNKNNQLRGCIGYTSPVKPLYLTVRDVAISAALKDPRFPAVNPNELPELHYEISVLSPFRKVTDLNQIKIGEHGLLIKYGQSEGLLLPQVATDNKWDRETFLSQTCRKAGLPQDTWREQNADIFMFSAFVFGEQQM